MAEIESKQVADLLWLANERLVRCCILHSDAPKVLVIMATYNGGKFVSEQIDSILAQEDVDVHLYVADDRSSDNTISILEDYSQKYPSRLEFVVNETNVGAKNNFMKALYSYNQIDLFDYVAFSDQDDIWLPRKLARGVEMLNSSVPAAEPALYYCDVTNSDGLREWSEMAPYRDYEDYPGALLLRNWVNGCAMVMNHSLVSLVLRHRCDEFPRYHDTWVHAIARYCGVVVPDLDVSLIRRRITGDNVIGESVAPGIRSLGDVRRYFVTLLTVRDNSRRKTAELLCTLYGKEIKPEYRSLVRDFSRYRQSFKARFSLATDKRFWKPTLQSKLLSFFGFILGWY